jgi:hypothetical protein
MVKDSSSKNIEKTAAFGSTFGWMTNLDLPMDERVRPWGEGNGGEGYDGLSFTWNKNEDNTNDNQDSWNKIRNSFRYNPEYDGKGFAYRWNEPRNQPELWDQMISNRPSSMANPARRFASVDEQKNSYEDLMLVAATLDRACCLVKIGKIRGTRFIVSDNLSDKLIDYLTSKEGVVVKKVGIDTMDGMSAIWVVNTSLSDGIVESAEKYVMGDAAFESVFDFVTNYSSIRKEIIGRIISSAKEIAAKYGLADVFIVGGYPRALVTKEPMKSINDLDFSSAWPDECLKLGELLAEHLGAENIETFHRTMTLSWEWMGVKCDFKGKSGMVSPLGIRKLMREQDIKTTPLNLDVYARDLTINTLIYSIFDNKIYDITKMAVRDINKKVINTIFDPMIIVPLNPLIILRAIKYAIKYKFTFSEGLKSAMHQNKELLFKKYSNDRLSEGLRGILAESKEDGTKMLEEFGLQKLFEL